MFWVPPITVSWQIPNPFPGLKESRRESKILTEDREIHREGCGEYLGGHLPKKGARNPIVWVGLPRREKGDSVPQHHSQGDASVQASLPPVRRLCSAERILSFLYTGDSPSCSEQKSRWDYCWRGGERKRGGKEQGRGPEEPLVAAAPGTRTWTANGGFFPLRPLASSHGKRDWTELQESVLFCGQLPWQGCPLCVLLTFSILGSFFSQSHC